MITIAPATPDDAATMLQIQKRAFAEEGRLSGTDDIPPLAETLASVEDHIRHRSALVAKAGDRVIGSIRGLLEGGVCTIRALSVEPGHQGQGIGSSLLRAMEALHPRTRFELTTNTVMQGNVPFYERHGYSTHELTKFSDRITLAQMHKPASDNA